MMRVRIRGFHGSSWTPPKPAGQIDPLNKKNYSSVSVNLNVADIKSAVAFYQKALGFAKRDIMTGPDAA
jgi:hypothetical protein